MMHLIVILLFVLSLTSCAHGPAPGTKPEDPDIRSFTSSEFRIIGGPLNLTGRMKKPEGDGPFPAVVLLHGCGGISPRRDHRWAERLTGWGYVTLQVDSFTARGIASVCTASGSDAADIRAKRVTDAYDAKRYLAGLPFVDKSRIAVMGWSHGGTITLETLYLKKDDPFRAAVALYPSCRRTLAGLNAPLLILIGEADDWTPAGRCTIAMPQEGTEFTVSLKVYPGAHHGFDTPGANTNVSGSRGSIHHLQYDPKAVEDAVVRVKAYFEKYLN